MSLLCASPNGLCSKLRVGSWGGGKEKEVHPLCLPPRGGKEALQITVGLAKNPSGPVLTH